MPELIYQWKDALMPLTALPRRLDFTVPKIVSDAKPHSSDLDM